MNQVYPEFYPRYQNSYPYYQTDNLLAFGILAIIALLFFVGLYALVSWLKMRIFKKAGLEGWKAWVPFYSDYIFFQLGGYPGWLILLSIFSGSAMGTGSIGGLLGIATLVVASMAAFEISKKVGKKDLWILYPLGILSFGITTAIWYAIIGNKDTVWQDNLGKPSLAKGTILGYRVVKTDNKEDKKDA